MLSGSLHDRLNMYALAAGAAGVGALALAPAAGAKVIYTPVHRHLLLNHPLPLDLNGDGAVDFTISRNLFQNRGSTKGNWNTSTRLAALPASSRNRIAGFISKPSPQPSLLSHQAYAMYDLSQIGPSILFSGGFMAKRWRSITYEPWFCVGLSWTNVKNRFLGLKFLISGQVHYGWARLSESCNLKGAVGEGARALLTGYAYETVADKPIVAGKTKGPEVVTVQPTSLGRLAQGSTGRSEK